MTKTTSVLVAKATDFGIIIAIHEYKKTPVSPKSLTGKKHVFSNVAVPTLIAFWVMITVLN
jgi:hypothetical protein